MKKLLIVLLLLSIPSTTQAAWAHVQTSGAAESGADANVAVAMGSNVTAGSLLVCWFGWASSTFSSISDTRSSTWNLIDTELSITGGIFLFRGYYAMNISGGADTITVTFGDANATNKTIICGEYSGIATSSALDQKAQQTQGSHGTGADGVSSSTTPTTTAAPELAAAGSLIRGVSGGPSAGTSYTLRNQQTDAFYYLTAEDRNLSTTGTYAGTFTDSFDGGGDTGAQVVTFKEASGGGSTTSNRLMLMGVGP